MRALYVLLYSLIFSFSFLNAGIITNTTDTPYSHVNKPGTCSDIEAYYSFENNYVRDSSSCTSSFPSQSDLIFSGGDLKETAYITNCRPFATGKVSYTVHLVHELACDYTCDTGLNDHGDGVCSSEPICPNEDTAIPNLNQSMCQGNFTNYDSVGSGTKYAELYWQSCDSTCRGVVYDYADCSELEKVWANASNCKDNEVFLFSCDEISTRITTPIAIDNFGNPYNSNIDTSYDAQLGLLNPDSVKCHPSKNPCDDKYEQVLKNCDVYTHHVDGYSECTHDGINITNDSIRCIKDDSNETIRPPDCRLILHAHLDSSTNKCICDDDFEMIETGSCWRSPDANATQSEIDADNEAKAKQIQEDLQEELDNNSTESQTQSLNNTEDTLSALRKDMKKNNDLLSDINSTNSKESTQLDVLGKLDDILSALTDGNLSIDVNVTIPGTGEDSNGTGEDNNDTGEDGNTTSPGDLKKMITDQFEKTYTIFNTDCGAPVFDPEIIFMDVVTVKNPLPIMHEHTEEYFDIIKILVKLGATLAGLLLIFRK